MKKKNSDPHQTSAEQDQGIDNNKYNSEKFGKTLVLWVDSKQRQELLTPPLARNPFPSDPSKNTQVMINSYNQSTVDWNGYTPQPQQPTAPWPPGELQTPQPQYPEHPRATANHSPTPVAIQPTPKAAPGPPRQRPVQPTTRAPKVQTAPPKTGSRPRPSQPAFRETEAEVVPPKRTPRPPQVSKRPPQASLQSSQWSLKPTKIQSDDGFETPDIYISHDYERALQKRSKAMPILIALILLRSAGQPDQ